MIGVLDPHTPRALRSRVSVAAPCAPVDGWLFQRTDEHRSRGRGPSAPVDGPQAPGGTPLSTPPRPAVHGRDEQDAPSSSMVVVGGEPTDAPSVAPGAGATDVDLPAEVRRRQASDRRRGSGAHPAAGKREPEVGVPQDPGRARQARHQGLGDQDTHAPAGERTRPGSPPSRSHLGRVPQVPGPGSWRSTSSPSRRRGFARCTCSSRSRSHPAVCTRSASRGTPTRPG